ncbi:XkdX family protein [Clostridium botulinum]|nr:XkdX family protein [Clostridium botulinum]NFI63879.1 XkdX family protein [Clostridium botulinum]NFJ44644.1 XkdX family protein [Clostridium botulinum]NFJ48271.1 XkdX family protein [Clostridium botulinum]NFK27277.1 XkdX family protein [Clostridium botulinum]
MAINWYKKITEYYTEWYWVKEMVQVAVQRGKISKEQYKEIVGEEYIDL